MNRTQNILIGATMGALLIIGLSAATNPFDALKAANDQRASACFKYGFQYGRYISLSRHAHVAPDEHIETPGPCGLTRRDVDQMRDGQ